MLNQKAVNEEKESYRVKVTSAGSTTHPVLGTIPNKGCFPIPVVMAVGTATTTNTDATDPGLIVTGVATLFLSGTGAVKPQVGDYLAFDAAGTVIRRIMEIRSDTCIKLEAKFVSNLSGSVYIVKKSFYKMIYAKSTGTADAILQEQGFAQGNTFLNGGSPVQYDASTSNAAIEFQLDE